MKKNKGLQNILNLNEEQGEIVHEFGYEGRYARFNKPLTREQIKICLENNLFVMFVDGEDVFAIDKQNLNLVLNNNAISYTKKLHKELTISDIKSDLELESLLLLKKSDGESIYYL